MFKPVLFAILCILCSGLALAQTEGTAVQKTMIQTGGPVMFGETNFFYTHLAGPPSPVTGAPYSAQATTETVQLLADGNRITRTHSENVARDSQGRMRHESAPFNISPAPADLPVIITINDPVAGYSYTL